MMNSDDSTMTSSDKQDNIELEMAADDVQMSASVDPSNETINQNPLTVGTGVQIDEDFDWETYISAYKGRTKIERLLFLAQQVPSLRIPCANSALQLITSTTKDVQLYNKALTIRNTSSENGSPLLPKEEREIGDVQWCEQTEKQNRIELEKLDLELRNYQNNLIKESIRMGFRDLGDHMKSVGKLNEAYKYYIGTRDYCSTNEHLVEMCLNVIEVSLDRGEYNTIGGNVNKAEGLLDSYDPQAAAASAKSKPSNISSTSGTAASKGGSTSGADAIGALFRAGGSSGGSGSATLSSVTAQFQYASGSITNQRETESQGKRLIREIRAKLYVAQGLANLALGRYTQAVHSFLQVPPEAGNSFGMMASKNDVATYIVLCGIAMYERKELKEKVLDRQGLSIMLEDHSKAQQLLESFNACEYKRSLSLLETFRSNAFLDPILSPHFANLTKFIIQRALRQFVQPFNTLKIERLANSLGWSGKEGEIRVMNELLQLIQAGEIKARLDLQNQVFIADKVEARQALFDDAFKAGRQQIQTSKRLILRVSLLQNGLIAKVSNDQHEA